MPPKQFKKEITVKKRVMFSCSALILAVALAAGTSWAVDQKPNILVVWGDDIGQSNISAYTMGLVAYLLVPAQVFVGNFLATFKDYPPRMKAASFSLDRVMEQMQSGGGTH